MKILILLISALLPVVLLFYYIWKKDPQKEPTSWLVKAVAWGVAICIPIAVIEVGIEAVLFGGGAPSTLLDTTEMSFEQVVDAICAMASGSELMSMHQR